MRYVVPPTFRTRNLAAASLEFNLPLMGAFALVDRPSRRAAGGVDGPGPGSPARLPSVSTSRSLFAVSGAGAAAALCRGVGTSPRGARFQQTSCRR